MIKEKLKQLREIEKEIHEYVGFKERWRVLPIDDSTEYYWRCDVGGVCFADTIEELQSGEGNCYDDEYYGSMTDCVYEAEDVTAICVNTHCDGNVFLRIFDNSKKIEL